MGLLDVLRSQRVTYQTASAPGEIRVCCPFCTDRGETEDTRFRLGVNVLTGAGHCFNCGWGSMSKAPYLVALRLGEALADESEEVVIPEETKTVEDTELPEGYEPLSTVDSNYWHRRALRYLTDRGVTIKQVHRHKIGYAMVGRYSYRIIFPVYWRKKLLYFVARDFTGKSEVRYLNTPGAKPVYGIPSPKRAASSIVLSEGIFKSLSIELISPAEDSGALLGHSITDLQLEQLHKCKYESITVWPDPDRPGIRGCVKVCDKLKDAGFKVKVIWPPPKKQADELSISRRISAYETSVKYTWNIQCKMMAQTAFMA